jgi:hypothetical protein
LPCYTFQKEKKSSLEEEKGEARKRPPDPDFIASLEIFEEIGGGNKTGPEKGTQKSRTRPRFLVE